MKGKPKVCHTRVTPWRRFNRARVHVLPPLYPSARDGILRAMLGPCQVVCQGNYWIRAMHECALHKHAASTIAVRSWSISL